jgi:hypothetical protein
MAAVSVAGMRISVVLDCLDPDTLAEFWCVALGYQPAGEVTTFRVLRPAAGEPDGPVLILQQVPEPTAGKNRMHLDVHPALSLGVPALVERLESLGGRRLGDPVVELVDEIDVWWQTMADPEGNVFDVVADPGHPRP